MLHSICDSYPKFGAAAPRQTGVITRRKKVGAFNAPPANRGLIKKQSSAYVTCIVYIWVYYFELNVKFV